MRHYFLRGKLFGVPDGATYPGLDYLTDEQEAFLAAHPQARPHEVRACLLDADRPAPVYPEVVTEQQQHETGV